MRVNATARYVAVRGSLGIVLFQIGYRELFALREVLTGLRSVKCGCRFVACLAGDEYGWL